MINYNSVIRKEKVYSPLRGAKALSGTTISKRESLQRFHLKGVGPTRSKIIMEFFKFST